jgi:ABC-type uncharacterized transport system involved in gliding motility auxiliary subunit
MPQTRSINEITDNTHGMKTTLAAKTSDVIIGITDVRSNADLQNIQENRIKTGSFGVIAVANGRIGGSELAKNDANKSKTKTDGKSEDGATAAKELRMVAFGSSKIATNLGVSRSENLDAILNATSYLLQDDDFISIRPKEKASSTIDVTSPGSQLSLAFYTYIYPFLFLGFGLVYWLKRRKA